MTLTETPPQAIRTTFTEPRPRFLTLERQVGEQLDADWNTLRDAIVGRRLAGSLTGPQAAYLGAYLRGASIAEAAAAADWNGRPSALHREVCETVGGFLIEDEQRRRSDRCAPAPPVAVAMGRRSAAPRRTAGSSGRPAGRAARRSAASTSGTPSGDDGPSACPLAAYRVPGLVR